LTLDLASEADTLALGAALAPALAAGMVVYLSGELGAGKTTIARGILRGLGYSGRVKSPTFTLVEAYELSRLYLYHFDFYRFESPKELDEAGLREYFGAHALCLVEWPEKAGGKLPAADLTIALSVAGASRRIEVFAATEAGKACLVYMRRST
jgi:tRNA threonylcarbamoyladenosine biosynthesis protein TsaE